MECYLLRSRHHLLLYFLRSRTDDGDRHGRGGFLGEEEGSRDTLGYGRGIRIGGDYPRMVEEIVEEGNGRIIDDADARQEVGVRADRPTREGTHLRRKGEGVSTVPQELRRVMRMASRREDERGDRDTEGTLKQGLGVANLVALLVDRHPIRLLEVVDGVGYDLDIGILRHLLDLALGHESRLADAPLDDRECHRDAVFFHRGEDIIIRIIPPVIGDEDEYMLVWVAAALLKSYQLGGLRDVDSARIHERPQVPDMPVKDVGIDGERLRRRGLLPPKPPHVVVHEYRDIGRGDTLTRIRRTRRTARGRRDTARARCVYGTTRAYHRDEGLSDGRGTRDDEGPCCEGYPDKKKEERAHAREYMMG